MSEKPYVPFYKPYGMSDEEYAHEVRIAEQRLAEWEAEQEEHCWERCEKCGNAFVAHLIKPMTICDSCADKLEKEINPLNK